MIRKECEKGFLVSFDYSVDALHEIDAFFKRTHKVTREKKPGRAARQEIGSHYAKRW